MKKYLFYSLIVFFTINANSQNINDGLRLAQSSVLGTARSQAMSGAFGALGGDFSAINVNPAGSAIFSNNQWSISLSDNIINNNTNYFKTNTASSKISINLNQAAGVFVFENDDKKSDWNKFSLAINYENISNFDNNIQSVGTNEISIANYFTSYANAFEKSGGIFLGSIIDNNYDQLNFADQQAWLGYESFIINPVPFVPPFGQQPDFGNPNISTYSSNIRQGGKYLQVNSTETKGQHSKINFNLSGQYQKWLSVGLNINSLSTDYKETTSFLETNKNANTNQDRVSEILFNNSIHTFGSGISVQLGFIAKVNDFLRLGASYQTPTWYELNDEVTQSVQTKRSSTASTTDIFKNTNPGVTNTYDPYQLQTPGKLTGSAALIFGKKGLLSLDLSGINYSNIIFKPENDFESLNNNITDKLSNALEIRLGTEYRIKKISLRGGFRSEQSPYKNKKSIADLYGISSGFGYNWGDTRLDVSYAYSKRNSQNQFFKRGLTDFSSTVGINHNVTFTLTFEL